MSPSPNSNLQARQQMVQSNNMVQTHMGAMPNNNYRAGPPNYGQQPVQQGAPGSQNSRLQNILQQPSNPQSGPPKPQQQYYMTSQGQPAQQGQHPRPMSQPPVLQQQLQSGQQPNTRMVNPQYVTRQPSNVNQTQMQQGMQVRSAMPQIAPQNRMMAGQQMGTNVHIQRIQQPGHVAIAQRPAMAQQPIAGQRIMSYPINSQGQQMVQQNQQVQQQQQQGPPQQHQHQHQQQPQPHMGWQGYPNQHNNMMHTGMAQQHGYMPQAQQINQMGNSQPIIRGGVAMGPIRGSAMMRPGGVARPRYPHLGHVVSEQDMLTYPNQGNFINRNQQPQQDLAPSDKLSHLIDKL